MKKRLKANLRLSEDIGDIQFLTAADGDEKKLRKFSMTAYNGGVLQFGVPIVVDLATLKVSAKPRPILRDHDPGKIVGHTERVDVTNSIRLNGVISGSGEHARQVVESADNEFPWQASIGASVGKYIEVEEGQKVTVNGREFKGPLYVAKYGVLKEVSFVALGADDNTSAKMTAGGFEGDSLIEVQAMGFEAWLEAMGLSLDALQDDQIGKLKAKYEAEIQAQTEADKQKNKKDDPPKTKPVVKASGGDGDSLDDFIQAQRKQLAAEMQRVNDIRELCSGKHTAIEAQAVKEGWDKYKTELAVLRAERPEAPTIVVAKGQQYTGESLEASLCLSAGLSEKIVGKHFDQKAVNAAMSKELRGAGLHTLIFEVIRASGQYIRPGRMDDEVLEMALRGNAMLKASGFSTISLSGILGNVANKTLLESYQAVPSVAREFCAEDDLNDFKPHTRYRMTVAGTFEKVGATGELKHTTIKQESYENQLDTYGRLVTLNRQMMTNDDLGAFLRIPRSLGRMSALTLEEAVFALLLANPNAFFSTDNKNYWAHADSALSIESLTKAEQMFLDRVDSDGKPVLVVPKLALVPTGLKVTAELLYHEKEIHQTPANNKAMPAANPHYQKFTPVASPYLGMAALTGNSQKAWYLFADPSDVAAMEIGYLRGQRTPMIQGGEPDFDVLGMQWRGVFDFGVAMGDHRGAVKFKGEA